MCLSIPSKITQIDGMNVATVDTMGVQRQVSLDLMPEPVVLGDYVLIHVGFAMTKMEILKINPIQKNILLIYKILVGNVHEF